jgi:uncharacterized secreted protein with C-terminal beta-propeller domain
MEIIRALKWVEREVENLVYMNGASLAKMTQNKNNLFNENSLGRTKQKLLNLNCGNNESLHDDCMEKLRTYMFVFARRVHEKKYI